MPVNLTNIEAFPVAMEDYPILGEYIQGGHGTETDFYNGSSKCILPGEPVEVFGRLGISKELILPRTFGTLCFGCWMSYLLDPDLASQILQGAAVYFDLDLADSDIYVTGYATNVQPTNGYLLGYAIAPHATPGEITKSALSAVAASTSSVRVFVLMNTAVTKYGTVPDFLATA